MILSQLCDSFTRTPPLRLSDGYLHASGHSFDIQDVHILERDSRWFERGVKEAIWVRHEQPSLNQVCLDDQNKYYSSFISTQMNESLHISIEN